MNIDPKAIVFLQDNARNGVPAIQSIRSMVEQFMDGKFDQLLVVLTFRTAFGTTLGEAKCIADHNLSMSPYHLDEKLEGYLSLFIDRWRRATPGAP